MSDLRIRPEKEEQQQLATRQVGGIGYSSQRIRILWITNVPLPEASDLQGRTPSPFGGWLVGAARHLAPSVDLSVASLDRQALHTGTVRSELITHYGFADRGDRQELDSALSEIINIARPDIVHIFGTEYRHARQTAEICAAQGRPFTVSIQGLVSVYSRHYASGLPTNIQRRFTLRDLVRGDSIRCQQEAMRRRGVDEVATLRLSTEIIGRTTWDEACVTQMNPTANYRKCNEILRESFYNGEWNVQNCERYSIFVSQGSYPIKGLHLMLEAMPLILKRFPRAHLFVAGQDVTGGHSLTGRLKLTSYGKHIRELIKENGLADHVSFTGPLDEAAMRERFLKSHVFALPSTIENSPNSLGEAMLLGVPTVAAAVGGVMDMAQPGVDALTYQADAPYMLAHQICRIFSSNHIAEQLGSNARARSRATHDIEGNTAVLIEIYNSILSEANSP